MKSEGGERGREEGRNGGRGGKGEMYLVQQVQALPLL